MSAQKAAKTKSETAEGIRPKTPFDDNLLAHFRALLLDKRGNALEEVKRMQAQIKDSREQSESDSAYSFIWRMPELMQWSAKNCT